tara:strand:- start:136588 stop:137880 length:1293 start_codon:yes stop_codon:yes gene_type:complete
MIMKTCKAVAAATVFAALAYSPAAAEIVTQGTANGVTTTVATNASQTNIVTTVVGGATSTVSITRGGGAASSGPAGPTVTFSLPSGGLPADVETGTRISLPGGGTAVKRSDGNFTVLSTDGTPAAVVEPDGTVVQVNYLGGSDATQSASIEQFSFDRANGFKSSQTGASAGGAEGKLALWVNGGYSTFDEDQAAIDADGDTWSIGVGGDWQFSERFIAGLALSGSMSDVNTTFNNGDIETTGYTISPYFVTILGKNKNLLLDGAFGYTSNDNDARRSFGAITSSYDSSSWFVSSNLTYIFNRGNFRVSPKVGILWLDNTTDGYTESGGLAVAESGSKLGRASAGARLDYTRYEKFTPFISFTGEYDFETTDYSTFTGANRPSVEDKGATLGAGFSAQLSDKVTGDISGTTSLGRDKYQAYSLSGTLRFNF